MTAEIRKLNEELSMLELVSQKRRKSIAQTEKQIESGKMVSPLKLQTKKLFNPSSVSSSVSNASETAEIEAEMEDLENITINLNRNSSKQMFDKLYQKIGHMSTFVDHRNKIIHGYKNKLNLMQKELRKDEEEIVLYKKSFNEIDQENEHLLQLLKENSEKFFKQQKLINAIKNEIGEEKKLQYRLIHQYNHKLEQLKVQVEKQQRDIQQSKDKTHKNLRSLNEHLIGTKTKLEGSLEKYTALQREYKNIVAEVEMKTNEVNHLNLKVNQLKQSLSNKQKDFEGMEKKYTDKLSELNEQIKECNELRKENSRVSKELDQVRTNQSENEIEKNGLNHKLNELQEMHSEVVRQFAELDEKVNDKLPKIIRRVDVAMDGDAPRRVSVSTSDSGESIESETSKVLLFATLEDKVSAMAKEYETSQKLLSENVALAQKESVEIQILQTNLLASQKELGIRESQLTEVKGELTTLREESASITESNETKIRHLEERMANAESLHQNELKDKLKLSEMKSEAKIESLNKEIIEHLNTIRQLETDKRHLKQGKENLTNDYERVLELFEKEQETVKQALKEQQQLNDRLANEINKYNALLQKKTDMDDKCVTLETEKDELMIKNDNLKTKVELFESEVDKLKLRSEDLENIIQIKTQQLEEMTEELSTNEMLKERYENLKKVHHSLEMKSRHVSRSFQVLKEEKCHVEQQLKEDNHKFAKLLESDKDDYKKLSQLLKKSQNDVLKYKSKLMHNVDIYKASKAKMESELVDLRDKCYIMEQERKTMAKFMDNEQIVFENTIGELKNEIRELRGTIDNKERVIIDKTIENTKIKSESVLRDTNHKAMITETNTTLAKQVQRQKQEIEHLYKLLGKTEARLLENGQLVAPLLTKDILKANVNL